MNELRIESRAEAIDDARTWVTEGLRTEGIGEKDLWAIQLALTEVLSNVMRHAYSGDRTREIWLTSRFADDRLELEILHWGAPLEAENRSSDAHLDTAPQGGYGLHLIDELVDEVERREAPGGGTVITLVKSRWDHS